MPRRKFTLSALAALAVVVALVVPALADGGHLRPSCAGQLDEAGFGSRDGWDHEHVQDAPGSGVSNSLYELEGFFNVCRTNDSVVAESASAGARAVKVTGVTRIALRVRLQRWNGTAFVTLADSGVANTGNTARTLLITTASLNEVGSSPAFTPGWYRAAVSSGARYSSGVFVPGAFTTYSVWLGDGPVSPASPPN
jgi:hypothetical protein